MHCILHRMHRICRYAHSMFSKPVTKARTPANRRPLTVLQVGPCSSLTPAVRHRTGRHVAAGIIKCRHWALTPWEEEPDNTQLRNGLPTSKERDPLYHVNGTDPLRRYMRGCMWCCRCHGAQHNAKTSAPITLTYPAGACLDCRDTVPTVQWWFIIIGASWCLKSLATQLLDRQLVLA